MAALVAADAVEPAGQVDDLLGTSASETGHEPRDA
jgi:hypothetical protein